MNVQLVAIYDRGNIAKERVHFRALTDIDLAHYAILDTIYTGPSSIDAGHRTVYWFGPKSVKAGQGVVLYTRAGTPSEEARPNGAYFHFLFRGLQCPLYVSPEACAVAFELRDWDTTKRGR